MRIGNFRFETRGEYVRVSATVAWEETARPNCDLYFETSDRFSDLLSLDGDGFLIACAFPAMAHKEKRLCVETGVCPELKAGMSEAMALLHHWYGNQRQPVMIEAPSRRAEDGRKPASAGVFFSGGVDSLAALRSNRINYPKEHPGFIRHALLVYGMNIESDDRIETFHAAAGALSKITNAEGIDLVPVYTNIRRELHPTTHFYLYEYHAAALSASAHSLNKGLATVYLGSTHDFANLMPWGSHPLLDPNFSSHKLRIRHDGTALTRFEKTKLVAEWELGLQNVKVCLGMWPGANCGNCEKCIRTMLALIGLGALKRCRSFPRNDLSEDVVRAQHIANWNQYSFYEELVAPLADAGRLDLVRGLQFILARFRSDERRTRRRDYVKGLDQRWAGGNLLRIKRLILGPRSNQPTASEHHA